MSKLLHDDIGNAGATAIPYPFPKQALVLTCLQYMSFENTMGKGKIARYEQFLLFLKCFLPF